jgi:hypothetical protein
MQLAAAAALRLAVHQDGLGREEVLDLAPAAHDVGELEQLAEPDHLPAYRDFARHCARY